IADSTELAPPDEMAAIDVFNDGLRADGHWVFAGGLGGPDTATVIHNRNGAAGVTAGPLPPGEEHPPRLWAPAAGDLDPPLRLAADGSKACNRKVEVRPFL